MFADPLRANMHRPAKLAARRFQHMARVTAPDHAARSADMMPSRDLADDIFVKNPINLLAFPVDSRLAVTFVNERSAPFPAIRIFVGDDFSENQVKLSQCQMAVFAHSITSRNSTMRMIRVGRA